MLTNHLQCFRGRSSRLRDLTGFSFFLFAMLISAMTAWQHPSILAWLYAFHNGLLAFFYARRRPAKHYDRTGLWLGIIAAFLPTFTTTSHTAWVLPGPRTGRLRFDFMVAHHVGTAILALLPRIEDLQAGVLIVSCDTQCILANWCLVAMVLVHLNFSLQSFCHWYWCSFNVGES